MDKNLLRIMLAVFVLGFIVSLTKLVIGGINFFSIGITCYALAPYMIHSILSYWVKSKWISAFSGLIIVGVDVYVHLTVFVFSSDAQAGIAFLFTPMAIGFLCVLSFIILTLVKGGYLLIKDRKINLDNYKNDFTPKRILLFFIVPGIVVFLWVCLSQFLISANIIFEHPIHKAITYNDFNKFKKLIDEGADINVPSRVTGQKPLMEATGTGTPKMIELLILKGANPDEIDTKLNMTPLMWAGFIDRPEAAKALIKAGADLNIKNNQGETALQSAIRWNYTDIIKVLLDAGADVNTQDNQGQTPLQKAAIKGNIKAFKEILKYNPDLSLKDHNGFTVFHWAAYYGQEEMVKILIDKGVSIDEKSNANLTANDYTGKNKHLEIVKLINKARKKKAEK